MQNRTLVEFNIEKILNKNFKDLPTNNTDKYGIKGGFYSNGNIWLSSFPSANTQKQKLLVQTIAKENGLQQVFEFTDSFYIEIEATKSTEEMNNRIYEAARLIFNLICQYEKLLNSNEYFLVKLDGAARKILEEQCKTEDEVIELFRKLVNQHVIGKT